MANCQLAIQMLFVLLYCWHLNLIQVELILLIPPIHLCFNVGVIKYLILEIIYVGIIIIRTYWNVNAQSGRGVLKNIRIFGIICLDERMLYCMAIYSLKTLGITECTFTNHCTVGRYDDCLQATAIKECVVIDCYDRFQCYFLKACTCAERTHVKILDSRYVHIGKA